MITDPFIFTGHDPRNSTVQIAIYEAVKLGSALVVTLSPEEARKIASDLQDHADKAGKKL